MGERGRGKTNERKKKNKEEGRKERGTEGEGNGRREGRKERGTGVDD